ncbi:MAG: FISUMP domain-containing protein [Bacteroidota bacterium]
MKRIYTILVAILLTANIFAQAPEKMSYQAVIRNASDQLVTDQGIGMQISILQGSATGTEVYVETHNATTNANGLVTVEIGNGTVVSGDFTTIDWSNDIYFIKTEIDPTGGTAYTITGTSQLLSVSYALHAKTAESIAGGINETDPSVPTGTQTGQMQYWNGTAWITIAAGNEGQVLTFTGGVPAWTTQLEDGEVKNPTTGAIWMDRNLGASQVATSSTDANAYGDLYQWGRGTDGHQIRTSGTTSTLATSDNPGHGNFILNSGSPYDWRNPQNDNLWQGVSGANNPCPSGYRLPTEAEWEAERASWSSNNASGAFASPLKLPVAGYRSYGSGSLINVGGSGSYWSSTVDGTSSRSLFFHSSNAYMSSNNRASGLSVRCLKD